MPNQNQNLPDSGVFPSPDTSQNKFPLVDGAEFINRHGGIETIGGEIKPPHPVPICWTIQGNWYRRSDGEPMTAAKSEIMTASEFYKLRRTGKL